MCRGVYLIPVLLDRAFGSSGKRLQPPESVYGQWGPYVHVSSSSYLGNLSPAVASIAHLLETLLLLWSPRRVGSTLLSRRRRSSTGIDIIRSRLSLSRWGARLSWRGNRGSGLGLSWCARSWGRGRSRGGRSCRGSRSLAWSRRLRRSLCRRLLL